uniref:Integrase, catalytic region, zinc finger, CCHC-type, peptidase aspartic, catalytic n=1 Tax=Tanacetum cinerariifolium TaxID=118510 RepID=A0A6L2JU54_TANCI|nr:hypothetical protein [Tanacetum cinerariifolium]
MILESVEHGLLIWPTVEENGATRTKKYVELSAAEKIQADCDMKETNIILQGLPSDIYSLVNRHRVSKDLWERIQLLMQGNSLTKQERESILYDAFDKFAHIKRESLHLYYLRFTQLINDMNIYNMKLEQFQVNTKFLNSLPPEWNDTASLQHLSVFIQLSSASTTVFTISIWINSSHSTLLINLSITISIQSFINSIIISYQSQMNHQSVPQIAYQSPQVSTQPITESPLVDSCFLVLVFSPRDDSIACLNKAMAFLTAIASSRFPSINNQLRTSSNPRNQATIQDGRVTVQQV